MQAADWLKRRHTYFELIITEGQHSVPVHQLVHNKSLRLVLDAPWLQADAGLVQIADMYECMTRSLNSALKNSDGAIATVLNVLR